MAKKSYDQRLKERWLRKQQKDKDQLQSWRGFDKAMSKMSDMAALILPFLFGKRNR